MFSMFPEGWPGVGLFLLRAANAATLIILCSALFAEGHKLGVIALATVLVVMGLLLLIGFLTRFAALVAALFGVNSVFAWFPTAIATPITAMLFLVIAVALICLGPGAWSLDARLFGRREIVIPRSSPK